QVSRAVPRVEMLTNLVGRERVLILLVGEGAASAREITKTLGVPVAGHLPNDPKTADVLSDGLGSRARLDTRPLLRAATTAGRALLDAAAAAGPLPGMTDQVLAVPGPADTGQPPGLARYADDVYPPGEL